MARFFPSGVFNVKTSGEDGFGAQALRMSAKTNTKYITINFFNTVSFLCQMGAGLRMIFVARLRRLYPILCVMSILYLYFCGENVRE